MRLLAWAGEDAWRAESARVGLSEDGIEATGVQLGVDPLPYRLDYRLQAPGGFVTRRLQVEAEGEGWRRSLDLARDSAGAWSATSAAEGEVELPEPGGSTGALEGALDCDLGLSPLTNMMPVRREGLAEGGSAELLMAWVSVPDLGLHASAQRYEYVRSSDRGAVVRYVDKGLFEGFTAELTYDADGFVLFYPGLARRVSAGAGAD